MFMVCRIFKIHFSQFPIIPNIYWSYNGQITFGCTKLCNDSAEHDRVLYSEHYLCTA